MVEVEVAIWIRVKNIFSDGTGTAVVTGSEVT